MSATEYLSRVGEIISTIQRTQAQKIEQAAGVFVRSMRSGGRVYLFGSGHSVIPVLDIFPRYGNFVGFLPHPRLPSLVWCLPACPANVHKPERAEFLLNRRPSSA